MKKNKELVKIIPSYLNLVKSQRDEFGQIKVSCGEFDPIYDNCFASDFFWAEFAIEFVGIENIKLTNIQKKKNKTQNCVAMCRNGLIQDGLG